MSYDHWKTTEPDLDLEEICPTCRAFGYRGQCIACQEIHFADMSSGDDDEPEAPEPVKDKVANSGQFWPEEEGE